MRRLDAGGFLTDAAQVFCLAAIGLVIAERGLLTADWTFATHRTLSSLDSFARLEPLGDLAANPGPIASVNLRRGASYFLVFSFCFLASGLCVLDL